MISLRKAIDTHTEEAFESTLESYRAVLVAMGNAGARACPSAGKELQERLLALHARLTNEAVPKEIAETKKQAEAQLHKWGEDAAQFNQEKTDQVKEILSVVAKAAGEVGERDQRYTKSFGDLAGRLQETTKLSDLTAMRQSLNKGVIEIKSCVAKMAKDGQDSVAFLRAQVASYETRLEEVERIASVDPLTGLFNRRKIEAYLDRQIRESRKFSVIYLDLNGFKRINDTLGHDAGDDLLKQFSGELRAAFRSTDAVGRWGGDEFIVVVDGDFPEAKRRLGRINQWVSGEYTLTSATGPRRVKLAVAAGIASWKPDESITDVLRNADAAMYAEKSRMKLVQQ